MMQLWSVEAPARPARQTWQEGCCRGFFKRVKGLRYKGYVDFRVKNKDLGAM